MLYARTCIHVLHVCIHVLHVCTCTYIVCNEECNVNHVMCINNYAMQNVTMTKTCPGGPPGGPPGDPRPVEKQVTGDRFIKLRPNLETVKYISRRVPTCPEED